jgi:hypothetical protein
MVIIWLTNRLLEDFLGLGEGVINMEQFRSFCKHNQSFLLPVLAVQDKLRAAAMGRPFWKTVSQRHIVLGLGRRVILANLIVEVRPAVLMEPHFLSASSIVSSWLISLCLLRSSLQTVDRELFHQLLHDQSASSFYNVMKSFFEGVQQTLHLTSPEASECDTQDAALERLFRPALQSPSESGEHGSVCHVDTRSLSADDERTLRLGYSL